MSEYRIETKCIHSGYEPGNKEPSQLPIVQATTWKYATSEDMGRLFDLEDDGYFYTRIQNPTNDAVAAQICDMEGGSAAILTSSGMSAIFFAVFNIVGCGDHIVASSTIYGGTYNLFAHTMKRMGIGCTFVDPDCSAGELAAAFQDNTKLLYAESLANPALTVLDIETWADVAHEHGVPLMVDNTFPTPANCRPFQWGADLVVHSTTKYMDGHAASMGGCIVDSGNFDWEAQGDRFACLTTPDETYHGVIYTQKFGRGGAYINKLSAQVMRDLGASASPMNSYILHLGLESMALRMQRHCENARKIAEFLADHPKVAWVAYPGLPGDKYYDLACKYMPNGTSGVIAFGPAGGREGASRMMAGLKLCSIMTHVADARTMVLHPASHTHRQMNDQELIEAGVSPDLVRLSVGIEHVDDIIADLDQALQLI